MWWQLFSTPQRARMRAAQPGAVNSYKVFAVGVHPYNNSTRIFVDSDMNVYARHREDQHPLLEFVPGHTVVCTNAGVQSRPPPGTNFVSALSQVV
mgnify:CR=1 FL=1